MEFIPRVQKSVLSGQHNITVLPKNEPCRYEARLASLEERVTALEQQLARPAPAEPSAPDLDTMDREDLLLLAASLGIGPIQSTSKLIKAIRKAQSF